MTSQNTSSDRFRTFIARPGGVLAPNSWFPAMLEGPTRSINVEDLAAKLVDVAVQGHRTQLIEVDVLRKEGKALRSGQQGPSQSGELESG